MTMLFCAGAMLATVLRYFVVMSRYHLKVLMNPDLPINLPGRPDLYEAIGLGMLVFMFFLQSQFATYFGRKNENLYYSTVYLFVVVGIVICTFAWLRLFRFTYELFIEFFIRILYRFRVKGEGFASFPLQGPVLVISNHACWWDPLFIAGELPRPMTAMMTAGFYDIWFLRPIMKHAFGVIRVPETTGRRETPEIGEAVAALNNGQCVVLFPEGYLRRKEDTPLRRFGRGVYEILKLRPETPVVACWIEGGWGSWCSWKDGPPVKGKKMDIRRKIDLGMAPPIVVPPELLENHLATRVFLMNAVSGARKQLGLEPLPAFPMPGPSSTIEDSGGV
ncbi:hypothetical protein BH11PLA2_BH11PLA2_26130 [soil metagenome]